MDSAEDYAKVWQLNNVLELTKVVKSSVDETNRRLEDMSKTHVSKEQLEAALKLISLEHAADMREVRDRYDPMRKNLSKLTWLILGIVVALLIQFGTNFIGSRG